MHQTWFSRTALAQSISSSKFDLDDVLVDGYVHCITWLANLCGNILYLLA